MATCKECGRVVNDGDKRCWNCNTKIVPITLRKVFNKTKEFGLEGASKIVSKSSELYDVASDEFDQLQKKSKKKSIERKKEKIKKLEKQLSEVTDIEAE